MESIKRIGLQTPITVRLYDPADEPILISGRHRLEACKRLNMEFIDCIEFEGSETDARLWEIAENLHRADLSALSIPQCSGSLSYADRVASSVALGIHIKHIRCG
jgi:ParB/RepB/Spo0J family partition protein